MANYDQDKEDQRNQQRLGNFGGPSSPTGLKRSMMTMNRGMQ